MKKKAVFVIVLCVLCTLSVLQVRNVLTNHRQNERPEETTDNSDNSIDEFIPNIQTPGLAYDYYEIILRPRTLTLLYKYEPYYIIVPAQFSHKLPLFGNRV